MIPRTVGIEVEYNGPTASVANELNAKGLCVDRQHSYHCSCEECNFNTGTLWRYQHDSTVDGEFITRVIGDWATLDWAIRSLGAAVKKVNKAGEYPVHADTQTGLHVHVGGFDQYYLSDTVGRYLLYERYVQWLGSGESRDKRPGMNITALNAIRELGQTRPGDTLTANTGGEMVVQQFRNDRHVDINFSRTNSTIEYRVFNSTTQPWQMELAVRLAVFMASGFLPCPEFTMPRVPLQTLQPPIPFSEFVAHFIRFDPNAEALVRRQRRAHPERDWGATDAAPPEPVVPEPRFHSGTWSVPPVRRAVRPGMVITVERDEIVVDDAVNDDEFERMLSEESAIAARNEAMSTRIRPDQEDALDERMAATRASYERLGLTNYTFTVSNNTMNTDTWPTALAPRNRTIDISPYIEGCTCPECREEFDRRNDDGLEF